METNEQMKSENKRQFGYFKDKNKDLFFRLLAKAEELENLVNAEATDIDEVLNMINGMQVI